ncbi:hypothetical protein [Thioalkalivibrio sp. HK1]|uniref:hypothetical protein n=1 Tax=Thioalkalivibrio sp. HK1 TaxID=1469245 RepID=UPI0012DFA4C5|nr:hypothetical protein [Thioalkalivibrio sp. HK1]
MPIALNSRIRIRSLIIAMLILASGAIASQRVLALDTPEDRANDRMQIRVGFACDRQSGEFLYQEIHEERWESGQLMEDRVGYRSPQGEEFAAKRVDYRASPVTPDFALDDRSTGHRESLERDRQSGALRVSYRAPGDRSDTSMKSEVLEGRIDPIADAGFERMLLQSWDRLLAGETITRPFLIPSYLQVIDMRLRHRPQAGDTESAKIPSLPDLVRFELTIDSFWLRLVVPAIEVYYESKTKELVRYEGPSNLRNAQGRNLDVSIDFTPRRVEEGEMGDEGIAPDIDPSSEGCVSQRGFHFASGKR